MSKKKKSKQARAEPINNKSPVALWLNGTDTKDILCPNGYTPLSQNEEIRRCIYKIADLTSNMTIMLMENGKNGDKRLKNELAKKIDIYPNGYMTRKNFIHRIVTDMCLCGNAVVVPEIEEALVKNLNRLQYDRLHFDKLGDDGYIIRYGGASYEPNTVLHFVLNPDDENCFKGTGYTCLIKQTVTNLIQENATKTGFLQSKWKPSLIISINSDIEELQDSDMRNNILGSYTKTTEIGEPWLIPTGEIDVKTIQPLTLNDLAIQDGITLDIKVIAAAFGIPASMMGVGTFDKEEYNNFIATTIMSMAINIQQELSKKLLYSPNMYFKFNPKSLMQYNLSEQVGFVKTLVDGAMLSRNEGRSEFDYAPVDKPGMDEYNVLENYIPIEMLGKQGKLKGGENEE